MADRNADERQPLLYQTPSSSPAPAPSSSGSSSPTLCYSSPDRNNDPKDVPAAEEDITSTSLHPSRAIEDDVLPESSTLGRNLTWWSCFNLVISRVIGSGIFATPGAILQAVGSPGLTLLLWIVGAVIAACGLAVSLEFGCMLPRSGADKVYLEFTYRRPRFLASTMVAMSAVFLGFTASNCVVFSQYVLFALGLDDAGALLRKGLALALLVVVTVTHVVFPKAGVQIQNILGMFKIAIIGLMILAGIYAIVFQPESSVPPEARGQLSWDRLWDDTVWNWGVISTSLFKVFYSFAGLDNISNVLNEVKDPVRTLRSVTMTSLFTACGMYLLINVAYFLVVPVDNIKDSGELIAALFFEQIFGVGIGRRILPLAVALSAAGNVFVVAFAMVR
jgi:amino acid transporter